MSRTKRTLLVLAVLLVAIQFIPSVPNQNGQMDKSDISLAYGAPSQIQGILTKACYDCHSNNTIYPWYAKIQPIRLFLDYHIKEGKENLNFSEFGSYSLRRQANKLRAIENSIIEKTMPLKSYTLIHTNSRLNPEETKGLLEWISAKKDSISSLR